MRIRAVLIVIFNAALLASCAATPRPAALGAGTGAGGSGAAVSYSEPSNDDHPLLGGNADVASRAQPQDPPNLAAVRYIGMVPTVPQGLHAPLNLAELYTRIIAVNTAGATGNIDPAHPDRSAPAASVRAYELEKRNFVARLISNRKIDISTFAQVQVTDPAVPVGNLPLFSISHDSERGQGETFATLLTGSFVQTPLFRLTGNTAMTVHVSTNISDQHSFAISAVVLRAVQTAVAIAAPASTIYTTLSKDEVANSAKALDTALGGLFSQSVSEDIQIGSFASGWQISKADKTVLARVRGTVPGNLVKRQGDAPGASMQDRRADKLVGIWEVQVLCPRPSLFDARDICTKIADTRSVTDQATIDRLVKATQADISASLTPGQVLTTNLSNSVTVQDFIKTQAFYTEFIGRKGVSDAADTKAFCAYAVDALYKAGLNQFDAQQVLWAMDRAMPGLNTLDPGVGINTVCHPKG